MEPRPTKPPSKALPSQADSRAQTGDGTVPKLAVHPPAGSAASVFAPPQQPDEIGRLGPYRILGELGRGGMGTVYRAEDPTLRRQLAIKVLAPHLAANPQAKARFLREAQAQAQVEHERITPIFHAGDAGGVAYIAMPLLKGQTLDAATSEGPLPLTEIVRIGREMAEGLAAAHGVGLVHRDIKPGNVWLEGSRQRVKLLDFGLARAAEDSEALTAHGAVVGTPSYMSPEQAKGQPVDHRTDLWSLGVVLYQLVTGEKPFAGPSPLVVLYAISHTEPPAPHKLAQGVPAALSELIRSLLAKDSADRPETADAVADELAAIERALGSRSTSASRSGDATADLNPMASLAEEQAEEAVITSRPRKKKPKRSRSKPNQTPLLVGALVLAAAVVIAIIVLIAQSGKSRPRAESPSPAAPDSRSQPSAQPAPKSNPPVPDTDLDREAARLFITRANVYVRTTGGQEYVVPAGKPLPPERFVVTQVDFLYEPLPDRYVEDVFLPAVARLKSLTRLRMGGGQMKLSAEHIRQIVAMPFGPGMTQIDAAVSLTSASMDDLKRMTNLSALRVHVRGADDALFARLTELPKLRLLTLAEVNTAPSLTARAWKSVAALPLDFLSVDAATDAVSFRALTAPGGPKHLMFYGCNLTDTDLATLAQNPTGVKALYFTSCPGITNAGLKHLENVLSLTVLSVRGTAVTPAGLQAFSAARKDVKLTDALEIVVEPKSP